MKHKGKFISVRKQNRLENLKRKENASVNDGKKEQKGTDEQKDKNDSWAEGRRIVELSVLAQGLKECVFCKDNLRLDACVDETKYGLASILYVKCVKCNNLNSVPTGKRHTTNVDGKGPPRCFDVNTKLAAAMLHAGIGEQQVNNILAELNLPSIHHKTLKEREREIGCVMEDIAENSCNAAIQAEIICSNSGDAPDLSCSEGAEVSCDGGWQKKRNRTQL
ncbi:uncharacterized protein LOC134261710 [Saccostrea cucullata]|uniref:uncharacterized protein LOC134261710 n=1 Tax=Saccostrea cuccullata TaxID=36930 RepID=UPI002ED15F96